MKRIVLLICAFLTLAYLDILYAQDVNLSGTWVLAKDKSTLTGRMWERVTSMTLVITQSGNAVKVETKMEGEGPGGGPGGGRGGPGAMNNTLEFTIGAAATESTTERGGKVAVKGNWAENQKDLIVDTERTMQGNMGTMTMKVNDTYNLSADGATLTVNRKSETPRGTMENTLVFAKQ